MVIRSVFMWYDGFQGGVVEIGGVPYLYDKRSSGYSLAVLTLEEADFLSREPFPMLAEYGNPHNNFPEIYVTERMLALCRAKAATHFITDVCSGGTDQPVEIPPEPFFASSDSWWWQEVDRDPWLALGSYPGILQFEVVLRHNVYSNFLLAAGVGPRAYLLSPIDDEVLVSEAPLSWLDGCIEWEGEPYIDEDGLLKFPHVRPTHGCPHPGSPAIATHIGRWAEDETALTSLRPLLNQSFPAPMP